MTGGTLPASPGPAQVMTDGDSGSRLGARQRHVIGADLAAMLAAARRSRGWSLREAGRRVGVAYATIAHLEHCRRAPSAYVADAIAAAYELAAGDAEWLRSAAIADVGKSSPLRARFGHGARPLSLVAVVHTGRPYGARGRVRHCFNAWLIQCGPIGPHFARRPLDTGSAGRRARCRNHGAASRSRGAGVRQQLGRGRPATTPPTCNFLTERLQLSGHLRA